MTKIYYTNADGRGRNAMTEPTRNEVLKYLLKRVSKKTIWGEAINLVLKSGDAEKFKLLIDQLTDQAKDNPAGMINILKFDIIHLTAKK